MKELAEVSRDCFLYEDSKVGAAFVGGEEPREPFLEIWEEVDRLGVENLDDVVSAQFSIEALNFMFGEIDDRS